MHYCLIVLFAADRRGVDALCALPIRLRWRRPLVTRP